jgi:hypothetical protein
VQQRSTASPVGNTGLWPVNAHGAFAFGMVSFHEHYCRTRIPRWRHVGTEGEVPATWLASPARLALIAGRPGLLLPERPEVLPASAAGA